MIPNNLKRHLELNHEHVARKSADYIRRLRSSLKKSSAIMGKSLKLSDKALSASFKAAELFAKKKTAHNIGEELILPACEEIIEVILVLKLPRKFQMCPCETIQSTDELLKCLQTFKIMFSER
jgi:MoxR-like ATPase